MIYVHRCIETIARGEHSHERPDDLPDEARTWPLECPQKGCEARILGSVEFTAHTAASVPLTVEEKNETEVQNQRNSVAVADLASALALMAKERVVAA
jgi:hypothetical protein